MTEAQSKFHADCKVGDTTIRVTVGFIKSDETRYTVPGFAPTILLSHGDLKGVTPDEFDMAVDKLVEDGAIVKVG